MTPPTTGDPGDDLGDGTVGLRAVQTAALERAILGDERTEPYLVFAAAIEDARRESARSPPEERGGRTRDADVTVGDGTDEDASETDATDLLTPTLVSLVAVQCLRDAERGFSLTPPGPPTPTVGRSPRERLVRRGARLAAERLAVDAGRVATATGVPRPALVDDDGTASTE